MLCPLINPPYPEGVIKSQPKTSFLGSVFDVDHDFEGPRAPKAHLDTVKYKPIESPAPPLYAAGEGTFNFAPGTQKVLSPSHPLQSYGLRMFCCVFTIQQS